MCTGFMFYCPNAFYKTICLCSQEGNGEISWWVFNTEVEEGDMISHLSCMGPTIGRGHDLPLWQAAVWDLSLEGDMISHLWQAAVWDIPLEEDMISPLWQAAVWDLLLDSLCSSNCPGVGTVGSAAQSQRTWETLSLLSIVTMMTVMCKSSIRYQHQVSPQWSIEACLVLLYYYSDNCDNHGAPPNTMWNYDLL